MQTSKSLTVSVVINTCDRLPFLKKTLDALTRVDYKNFEVIVVNGPSTDGTEEFISNCSYRIKIAQCPERNLSQSRNIGIAQSSGDIVAFIDDDSLPDSKWISNLVAGYSDPEVGAVGGFCFDHTGYSFQSRYITCDRVGWARFNHLSNPSQTYNLPFSREYCSLMGTNCSFRRDVLLQIGGFDEFYKYFLDETDVCVRVVDAGYKVIFVDDALVYHKFAPSHTRDVNRVNKNYHINARSVGYFSIRNGGHILGLAEVLSQIASWRRKVIEGINWQKKNHVITESECVKYLKELDDGLEEGITTAQNYEERQTLQLPTVVAHPFKNYTLNSSTSSKLTLCFVSEEYPPGYVSGIGRWIFECATSLAELGHEVHVITKSKLSFSRVDYENHVWVHRISDTAKEESPSAKYFGSNKTKKFNLPEVVATWTTLVKEEIDRITFFKNFDAITCPIWNLQGLGCIEKYHTKLVTSLHTTFALMLENQPAWTNDKEYFVNHVQRMIAGEESVLRNSRHILANSKSVVDSINKAYRVKLSSHQDQEVAIIPHGVSDLSADVTNFELPRKKNAEIKITFLGRLEMRKGIDVILDTVPSIIEKFPTAKFYIIGESIEKSAGDQKIESAFIRNYQSLIDQDNVVFLGCLDDEQVFAHLSNSDIFIAPSRYESFGLVFIEAYRFGLPVIGCNAGGMTEVIIHEQTGLLAIPGDSTSFEASLIRLISDEPLRKELGKNARLVYETSYASNVIAKKLENYFFKVARSTKNIHYDLCQSQ
jgi:glycogen synthase